MPDLDVVPSDPPRTPALKSETGFVGLDAAFHVAAIADAADEELYKVEDQTDAVAAGDSSLFGDASKMCHLVSPKWCFAALALRGESRLP
tara:strand:- start:419 stop:688 length:270 start_codon:yes stop_codon:yes gene_type:complete